MKFELSMHARKAVIKRDISLEWIERTLTSPQKTEEHKREPDLRRHWLEILEIDNWVLHIVVNHRVTPVRVVTTHIDRNMRGKL